MTCHLDHVLIELDDHAFEAPPSILADNFTIIEGGTHANHLSRNKLIIFPDGTYLELLNWLTKDPASQIAPGDFALTTPAPVSAQTNYERIIETLHRGTGDGGLGVTYTPPQAGGRRTTSGEELRWELLVPQYTEPQHRSSRSNGIQKKRRDAPFFCHDVTDRALRVPTGSDAAQHPCGAKGFTALDILVPREQFSAYTDLYKTVFGGRGPGREEEGRAEFVVGPGAVVRVVGAQDEEDEEHLRRKGAGVRAMWIGLGVGGQLEVRM